MRGALRGQAGQSDQFSWNFGGEYALQRDDRQNHGNDGGERADLRLDQLENVRTLAFFGQGDLRVSERARLVGGVRYDRLDFSVEDAFLSNGDDSGDRLMDAISPSVGLHVAATRSVGLFVNVGTSFESPTTTELANDPSGRGGFNPELNPQRSLSLEVGTRGVSDNTFAYELSVFRTGITDALVPIEVPDIDRTFYANAGSASHRGFEAAFTLAPGGRASLRATYSYTDAVFDDYVVDGTDYGGNQIPGLAPHRPKPSPRCGFPAGSGPETGSCARPTCRLFRSTTATPPRPTPTSFWMLATSPTPVGLRGPGRRRGHGRNQHLRHALHGVGGGERLRGPLS